MTAAAEQLTHESHHALTIVCEGTDEIQVGAVGRTVDTFGRLDMTQWPFGRTSPARREAPLGERGLHNRGLSRPVGTS
ncbi:hypothetical protein ACFFSW_00885 [Saccharothrix longispora]|uniref:Uncharacterized protein n=1 Tax=Saccharothrix longispora TaxID=33920 RepID=A0ABU1PV61_9PSEU|nr:hypothetical protein [Saccharothrix longispora]MDR6594535.1 hypothetical protein [Saccharothrix longispora]